MSLRKGNPAAENSWSPPFHGSTGSARIKLHPLRACQNGVRQQGARCLHVCRFSAAGMMAHLRAEAAGGRKAPRHEVAGSWVLAGSERYWDFDISPELVCGRDADPPDVSTAQSVN